MYMEEGGGGVLKKEKESRQGALEPNRPHVSERGRGRARMTSCVAIAQLQDSGKINAKHLQPRGSGGEPYGGREA